MNDDSVKTRSPRCPSISLEDALKRTEEIYEKNGKHPVALNAAAEAMGYKNADNGAAKATMASLAYYGLVNKSGGKLAVATEYEKYQFAPDTETRAAFLSRWVSNPKVFANLINQYGTELPSDASIRYELLNEGFKPDTAAEAIKLFRASLTFVRENGASIHSESAEENSVSAPEATVAPSIQSRAASTENLSLSTQPVPPAPQGSFAAIPIFLHKGRQAVLHAPRPFYAKDREVIIRALQALLTDDEDGEA